MYGIGVVEEPVEAADDVDEHRGEVVGASRASSEGRSGTGASGATTSA